MPAANYNKEQIGATGKKIYQDHIKRLVEPHENGKFIVIDIESGDFEIDEKHFNASKRLRERRPESVRYAGRIGYSSAYRVGRAGQPADG